MGEYATRKSDGQRVKIGVCQEMYYLRYEDRFKVTALPGNVDPVKDAEDLRFRLPFPDEDNTEPGAGEYEPFKAQSLYRKVDTGTLRGDYQEHFQFGPDTEPGTFQLHHESGLLLSVPCYHGNKLPEVMEPMRATWNGKSWFAELKMLRPAKGQVWPVVGCKHCREQWRMEWSEIWDYIPELLRDRLRPYAAQYAADKACLPTAAA